MSLTAPLPIQEDEPAVPQNASTVHCVGHATDEEKLASTTTGQKAGKAGEERTVTEEAVEGEQWLCRRASDWQDRGRTRPDAVCFFSLMEASPGQE